MRKLLPILLSVVLLFTLIGQLEARTMERVDRTPDGFFKPSTFATPATMNCVHNYNNLHMSISNRGRFGSELGNYTDCETGMIAPSGEFPAGSQVEYLFQGALWIGAVIGEDTLVSVGADGWTQGAELWPCGPSEDDCGIQRRSTRPSDPYYSDDAISDLDFIAVYSDTNTDPSLPGIETDERDFRQHKPIGIEITQRSYSWSVDYAEDFILFDFSIRNMKTQNIENLYLGVYTDGDVGHISHESDRYTDDICGFLKDVQSAAGPQFRDTVDLTYIMDNDGDPNGGVYDYTSATGLLGTRVMRSPRLTKTSFNWYQGNGNPRFDWGPMLEATKRSFGTGGQGTPAGDRNKYYLLSNGEVDYDQIFAAQDKSDEGWLPPSQVAAEIANGGDTRFLLSFGPFDIAPNDSLNLTAAYIAGGGVHRDPTANGRYMNQNPPQSELFLQSLHFDEPGENAVWAAWVYDNPGVDTDNDGNFGKFWLIDRTNPDGSTRQDTFWYAGDGVPDFRAATAPPPPVLRFSRRVGGVSIKWNGFNSETATDPFTKVADFEGYKVYMGRDKLASAMALVESRDFMDFKRFYRDTFFNTWVTREIPLTLDSLRVLYGDNFDPTDYTCNDDGSGGFLVDSTLYCFEAVDWNQSIEGWLDGAFASSNTQIKKTYAADILAGKVTKDLDSSMTDNWVKDIDPITGDSVLYHRFYEYEFDIDDILSSVPWYFSVTAFDFGDFTNNLASMESSPLANVVEVFAQNDANVVVEQKLQPSVFPNPYMGDGRYFKAGYEDNSQGAGFVDHVRKINFINLPHKATIKIFTLSGDLIRTIDHYVGASDSPTDSRAEWNMRSRNNELVASGIYLYSVESDLGTYVGKLVIVL